MTRTIAPPPPRTRATNPWVVLAIVVSGAFMLLVDVSIVNVAIPSIQRELHATSGAIQLILAGYQLAFACVLITAGRLGDIHGRRRLFLIGLAGFTLASAAAGAAPSAYALVGARIVQGFLGGLMFPQVLSVIQVAFRPDERGRALGVFGAVIGVATVLGPLVGGALIYANVLGLGWRTIFYVNVPIGAAAYVAAHRWLRESRAPDAPRLDVPGVALVTVGLFMLILPIIEGRELGWPPWFFAVLAGSGVVLAVFARYELGKTRRRESPLVPMTLFGDRAFRTGLPLVFVFLLGLPAFFFTFTLYLQIGFGYSALQAGLISFPFAVASGTASFFSDRLARRLGKWVLSVGSLVAACGMGAILLAVHVMGTDLNPWALSPLLLIGGAGLGTFIAPVITIVLSNVRASGAGSASGVLTTVQRVGGAVGVAVVGVLYFGLLTAHAGAAANAVEPGLAARLHDAGLSQAATRHVVDGFHQCFVDRASSGDPQVTPASCQRSQAASGSLSPAASRAVERAVRAYAAPQALRRDFSFTFQRTLLYEMGAFVSAFLLVFLLPGRARGGAHARSEGTTPRRSRGGESRSA
ncbi:MAG: MFS transporter [Streptosporangiaceae bacterium]